MNRPALSCQIGWPDDVFDTARAPVGTPKDPMLFSYRFRLFLCRNPGRAVVVYNTTLTGFPSPALRSVP